MPLRISELLLVSSVAGRFLLCDWSKGSCSLQMDWLLE